MSTQIRPEISQKNPYWIPKHRYYELKHFVMQYPAWVAARKGLDFLHGDASLLVDLPPERKPNDTCPWKKSQ